MRIAIALLPVLLFIGLLLLLDSFKLVRLRAVLESIALGGVAALAAAVVNRALLEGAGFDVVAYSRYVAPLVEEFAKAFWVVLLIRRDRVGFLVDAAILGFAVGAGFALVENIDYLLQLPSAGMSLWFARGCGTAILHGATTATFAVLSKNRHDHKKAALTFVPGIVAAIVIHSFFNHFVLPPILQALVLLATLPPLLVFVFDRSEKTTRVWLGSEFDGEMAMLQSIVSGEVLGTRTGAYLEGLKSHFPGEVVADMLCLLQIHLELSLRAKGLLIARAAGIEMTMGEDAVANLKELSYLESQIGRTGLLAMKPILAIGSRELWKIRMLQDSQARSPMRR